MPNRVHDVIHRREQVQEAVDRRPLRQIDQRVRRPLHHHRPPFVHAERVGVAEELVHDVAVRGGLQAAHVQVHGEPLGDNDRVALEGDFGVVGGPEAQLAHVVVQAGRVVRLLLPVQFEHEGAGRGRGGGGGLRALADGGLEGGGPAVGRDFDAGDEAVRFSEGEELFLKVADEGVAIDGDDAVELAGFRGVDPTHKDFSAVSSKW